MMPWTADAFAARVLGMINAHVVKRQTTLASPAIA